MSSSNRNDDASWGNENKPNPAPFSAPPSPLLPRSMMPGYVPSTVHKSDLFFTTPPPIPQNRPLSHHSYSASRPTISTISLSRSRTAPSPAPPVVPPKTMPIPSPPLPPPKSTSDARPQSNPAPAISSPVDQAEFQAVLELSKSESQKQALFLEKLSSQEEDDLARALEESMRSTGSHSSPGAGPSKPSVPFSTHPHRQSPTSVPSSLRNSWDDEHYDATSSNPDQYPEQSGSGQPAIGALPLRTHSSVLDDEAFARQLAAEEENEEVQRRESARSAGVDQHSLEDDEAFARRLALEEEEEDKHEEITPVSAASLPPAYLDAVSPSQSSGQSTESSSVSVESSLLRSNSSGSSTSYVSSSESLSPRSFQPLRPVSADVSASDNNLSTPNGVTPATSSMSLPSLGQRLEQSSSTVNVNQFVDKELLHGVSIGFMPPAVSEQTVPLQGVMPNIITLPQGPKCPPLHLQATSWRHLLKLMARLSGTRMEPTADALALNGDHHLRTVIQFVRPHYGSPAWRTVIWFTIDQTPTDRPLNRRTASTDVDNLPYSYTQSTLPTLLRDGSDSPLSKTYTIPATSSVPFPVLPIYFPNLALYLQAALDESRRYMNDSSSGIRKLAKMMESCYPSEFDGGNGSADKSRMGGLFKKVIGRGGKSSKKGRGGNEETYELVTPFVPDEWG